MSDNLWPMIGALKRACTTGCDKQVDDYMEDMVDEIVCSVRAAAMESAAAECERISLASKADGYGTESAAEQGCADAIRLLARGASCPKP